MTPQQAVSERITARGYRKGFSPETFALRQIVKLAEELGELAGKLGVDIQLFRMISYVRWLARSAFDLRTDYDQMDPTLDYAGAKEELADLQVVILVLADQLEKLSGEPYDVVQAALKKSRADIERGVR